MAAFALITALLLIARGHSEVDDDYDEVEILEGAVVETDASEDSLTAPA